MPFDRVPRESLFPPATRRHRLVGRRSHLNTRSFDGAAAAEAMTYTTQSPPLIQHTQLSPRRCAPSHCTPTALRCRRRHGMITYRHMPQLRGEPRMLTTYYIEARHARCCKRSSHIGNIYHTMRYSRAQAGVERHAISASCGCALAAQRAQSLRAPASGRSRLPPRNSCRAHGQLMPMMMFSIAYTMKSVVEHFAKGIVYEYGAGAKAALSRF